MDRSETIKAIKNALKARSGKQWSVTGGRGTSYGWIEVHVLPAQRSEYGYMPDAARKELSELLGFENETEVHHQGWSIPASSEYRQAAIDRAEGRTPSVNPQPYWD